MAKVARKGEDAMIAYLRNLVTNFPRHVVTVCFHDGKAVMSRLQAELDLAGILARLYVLLGPKVNFRRFHKQAEFFEYITSCTDQLANSFYEVKDNCITTSVSAKTAYMRGHSSHRNKSDKQTWLKCLMQIPGCTEERGRVIVQKYPTMHTLFTAYSRMDSQEERAGLLADIRINGRRLGPVVSARIAHEYCSEDPGAPIQQ
jgi:hypothetical protein